MDLPGLGAVSALGSWLSRIPYWAFGLLVALALLIHHGFWFAESSYHGYLRVAQGWPSGQSWDSSPLWLAVIRFVPVNQGPLWPAVWLLPVLAAGAVMLARAPRLTPPPYERLLVLGVAVSGIPLGLLWSMGWYDVLFLTGVLLLTLGGRFLMLVGCLIAASSNAEMGLVAGIAALFVTLATTQRAALLRSLALVASSISVCAVVWLAQRQASVATGRIEQLGAHLWDSVLGNLAWLPMTVGTAYGAAWFLVILMIFSSNSMRQALLLAVGLIGIPVAFTIVTLDGTRVMVGTSSAAYLFALLWWLERVRRDAPKALSVPIALLFIAVIALPAAEVVVYNSTMGPAPWAHVAEYLGWVRP